jgi:RNA polymerase sigma-70 factor (ECF subfamily)
MGMFSSWLYRIATNCAKKEFRRKGKETEISIDAPTAEDASITLGEMIADDRSRPDYELRQKELKEFVYKAMSRLDRKYRDVLMLCDVEGLSYEDAARALRSIPRTVGTRLRRARQMLYELLKKHGFEL